MERGIESKKNKNVKFLNVVCKPLNRVNRYCSSLCLRFRNFNNFYFTIYVNGCTCIIVLILAGLAADLWLYKEHVALMSVKSNFLFRATDLQLERGNICSIKTN